jgi:hypothetical protein
VEGSVTKRIDAQEGATVAGDRDDAAPIEETLDRLSLRQALLDFEVANARVLDLTSRLVDAQQEVAELRRGHTEQAAAGADVDGLRADLADVTFRYDEILRSRTYRLALVLRRIRERLGA